MFLLIDGKHFVYRAFYGTPELTRSTDQFPIGAIHGWVRIMWRLLDEYPTDTYEIFWDAGSAARNELSADYKANRKPVPDAMKPQLPIIEELANHMGLTSYKEQGMEADDLIASRAWELAEAGHDVLIVSADKDFAQCVTPASQVSSGLAGETAERSDAKKGSIHMLTPPPTANPKDDWRRLDAAGIAEKFGVEPAQIAEMLAIMGDTSDNVKGLVGVGPKTASEWLRTYKTLDGIIDNCGCLNPKRFQNIVYASQEQLRNNLKLTKLHRRTLPNELRTPGAINGSALIEKLRELHLKTCAEEADKRYGRA